jgi:hypothetical protein
VRPSCLRLLTVLQPLDKHHLQVGTALGEYCRRDARNFDDSKKSMALQTPATITNAPMPLAAATTLINMLRRLTAARVGDGSAAAAVNTRALSSALTAFVPLREARHAKPRRRDVLSASRRSPTFPIPPQLL